MWFIDTKCLLLVAWQSRDKYLFQMHLTKSCAFLFYYLTFFYDSRKSILNKFQINEYFFVVYNFKLYRAKKSLFKKKKHLHWQLHLTLSSIRSDNRNKRRKKCKLSFVVVVIHKRKKKGVQYEKWSLTHAVTTQEIKRVFAVSRNSEIIFATFFSHHHYLYY